MTTDHSPQGNRALPRDIKLTRAENRLSIVWQDGTASDFDMATLRKNCPCATCNSERQNRATSAELFPILRKDPGTGPPSALGAKLVGNYALQIQWADGHDTGIYDFRLLRALADKQAGL